MSVQEEMLVELKNIREALEPKPAAPPPPPKGLWAEFVDFLGKYGVLGLAVGFMMGTYAGKVASALVNDIIMPIVMFFIPGGAWRAATLQVGPVVFGIGDFFGVIVDFLIMALVIFLIARYAQKLTLK